MTIDAAQPLEPKGSNENLLKGPREKKQTCGLVKSTTMTITEAAQPLEPKGSNENLPHRYNTRGWNVRK